MKNTLREALDERGYTTLTPVQTAVIDPKLEGSDLLVSAQTGSGKTLGFGLAIAPTLLGEDDHFVQASAPLGLVIAPTRELALQVKRELSWLFAKAGAVLTSCVGGMDMRDERRALGRGTHIVVATPGRLRDHIMRGSIDLSELRSVVLDEADEMLDLGFREDLEFILGEAPETRQTLLFSATVPASIAQLAKNYQKDAVRVVTKSETAQHADIEYKAMMVADRDAENAVINTLRFYEAPNAIVFANTRAMVNRLTTRLSNRSFQVVALSGELSQAERTHALQAMRDGRARICVATDVAARGIDLPNLDLVVHAELPNNHETLLHRSGRTGRAGRKGVSALIVTKKFRKKAERILQMAKLKADWTPAPSAEAVQERDEERLYADPSWHEPLSDAEQTRVAALLEGFSAQQVGAAFLRLYHGMRTAPEELSDIDAKPEPRAPFGPSIWFSVTGGRDSGAEPRRLLPMLCKAGGLNKDDIGAIRIQQSHSVVQIREPAVAAFLSTLGAGLELEAGAKVAQLDAAPSFDRAGPGERKPPNRGPKPGKDRPAKPYDKAKSYDKAKPVPSSERRDAPAKPKPPYKKERPATYTAKDAPTAKPAHKKERPAVHAGSDAATAKPARKTDAASPKPAASDNPKARANPDKPRKPKGASDPGMPLRRPGKPREDGKPKGPPPPKGKASSKKNRARAQAATSAKKRG